MNMDTKIRMTAREDCQKLLKKLSKVSASLSPQCKMLEVHPSRSGYSVNCRISLKTKQGCKITSASWNYRTRDNSITSSFNVSALLKSITGSVSSKSRKIYAAEGDDEFDDEDMIDLDDEDFDEEDSEAGEDFEDDEDFEDELEDEVELDETNLPTDNNIENHYIVECDNCHGIFISALVESDQLVRNIRGICPLCDKESDQYINWIVRKVDNEEFEEEENFEEFFEIP